MTHTLHRRGTLENLREDYVVFAIAEQTINLQGATEKFAQFAEIVLRYNPINFGDMKTGNVFSVGLEKIQKGYKNNSVVHAVFDDPEIVAQVLKDLKEADLGISVVVSGLFDEVTSCCSKVGLEPHTVEHSLGIWGRTELLPEEEILEISTMCGHGMVAFSFIEHLVDKVKAGVMTAEEAAKEMAKQCHCGVFNHRRAQHIIEKMLS